MVVALAAVVVVAAAEVSVAAVVMEVEVMTVETTVVPPCECEGASVAASGTASGKETTATDASSGAAV